MSATAGTPGSAPVPLSLTVISHTGLVYWWPVWLTGFILYAMTLLAGDRLAIVPRGTKATSPSPHAAELTWSGPPTSSLAEALNAPPNREAFPVHVASNRHLGLIFLIVLLVVIFGTNVVLRGLWSLVFILCLGLLAAVFVGMGWWDPVLQSLGSLEIYLTGAGYLFVSTALFLLWLVTVFVFDQRRFMTFTPGQVVFHREIGDQSQVFDTTQIKVQKRRSDLLRHFLLGLGSGDLLITLATGSGQQQFELPNVLFVDTKVEKIAAVMKMRLVVPE